MIALADCNTFFASVERALHPGLKGKPVCVLSSNDGNVIALTTEAKALGIKRGAPFFEVKDIIRKNNVAVFSSNIMLYAAMSERVQSIMRKTVKHTENYSIDEQFLYLDGYEEHFDIVELMRGMIRKIALYTDIPVSIGIAPTKTLAKVASKFAKKFRGYRGVCMIDTDEKRRKALALADLADIWGIGPRTYARLVALGVRTALEFADKDGDWVQRQSISTSRSFGKMISSVEQLKSSVATFAASCCNTLRGQDSAAGCVSVFACSNRFREDLPQYGNMASAMLGIPSADTLEITKLAMRLVEEIYRPGILFKKSGVILSHIVPGSIQPVLFDTVSKRDERLELSKTIDRMNHQYGVKTVGLAVEGSANEEWEPRRENLTPNYLTDINQIMVVNV